MDTSDLQALVRDIPNFPQDGIDFKDITPLLADETAFSRMIDLIVGYYRKGRVDLVAGIEARGFILAAPAAYHLGVGFVPVRKIGKLPWHVESESYALEYGTATLEIHRDAIKPGQHVLVVDDVLATGGTAEAAAALVERLGGVVSGIACLLELTFLNGRERIGGYDVFSLIRY